MAFRLSELRRLIREAAGEAYRILGLSPKASPDEIRAAFRKLLIQNHPDRNPGKDTTALMARINVANQILSDPEKRKRYDQFGDRTVDGMPQQAPAPSQRNSGVDQAARWAAEEIRRRQEEERRRKAQQAQQSKTPSRTWRFFVFQQDKSNKFWNVSRPFMVKDKNGNQVWYVITQWGRVNTGGQHNVNQFNSEDEAIKLYHSLISQKFNKGYRETTRTYSSSPPPGSGTSDAGKSQQAAPKSPPPPEPKKEPSGKTRAGKKSYKIYGKKGNHRVHTRVGGRMYVPTGNSRFSSGDSAEVAVGSDGRATIRNPKTGHTQVWDNTKESVEPIISRLVFEAISETLLKKII